MRSSPHPVQMIPVVEREVPLSVADPGCGGGGGGEERATPPLPSAMNGAPKSGLLSNINVSKNQK